MTSSSGIELKMTTLDCAGPRVEAAFWSELLGWDVAAAEDEYAVVVPPGGGAALGSGRVVDHQAPGWPNERGSKPLHVDLGCNDIEAEQERAVGLGATVPDVQPGETCGCSSIRQATPSA